MPVSVGAALVFVGETSVREFRLKIRDIETRSTDLRINTRGFRVPSACGADITDRRDTRQNPNDITRILGIGEVRIMLVKKFNGHDFL